MKIEIGEENKQKLIKVLEYLRYGFTIGVNGLALLIILHGIFDGTSGFKKNFPAIPNWVGFFFFIIFMFLLAMLEGAQVCILDLSCHSSTSFAQKYPRAAATHRLISGQKIGNVARFMIGRQVMIIFTFFFLAMVTSFPNMEYFPFTKNKFPHYFKVIMIDTGLFSTFFIVSVGSLLPQLIATNYPVQFLNVPIIRVLIHIGLAIDFIGVAHFCWFLYIVVTRWIARLDYNVTLRLAASDEVISQRARKLETLLSKYQTPQEITEFYRKTENGVPLCLEAEDSKNVVPPHVVACWMLELLSTHPEMHEKAASILYNKDHVSSFKNRSKEIV